MKKVEYKNIIYMDLRKLYINKKYNLFEQEATKYLKIYPNDTEIRFKRAKVYRKLEQFDKAIADLKYNLKFDDIYSLTELYYLYYFLNMYEEAIELLPKVYETRCINATAVAISEQVMRKQLNSKIKMGSNGDYIRNQISRYNIQEVLKKIEKHKTKTNSEYFVFPENIDLEYLLNTVRENIKNSKKLNSEEILEVHFFAVANIGRLNGEKCNFIRVIVIPNTDHVINIYPTKEVDANCVSQLDCDYDKLFKIQKENEKTKSRIDKFNNKWRK